MKKVLFTASTCSHILHFHLPYLKYFQDTGWTVHVACGGGTAEIPGADEVIPLPFKKKMTAPGNFKAAGLLRRRVAREGYELICAHTTLAAFFTRLALRGMKERPRVVNMVHGYLYDGDTPPLKRAVLRLAERLSASRTDLLLTMNRWDYEEAAGRRLGARVELVPGVGVDFQGKDWGGSEDRETLRRELGLGPEDFALIYAAEFSKRKSQQVLIQALKQLPLHAAVILPGEGALLEECRALARRLGVEDRVFFPGYIRDMERWYAAADAAASASRSEGLPFNIMEAMYAGLPVVASAVKGHEDLIREGETGLLYPYGDSEACARQVLRLMGSQELRETLARRARRDVLRYGLEQVLPVVTARYESLLPARAVR